MRPTFLAATIALCLSIGPVTAVEKDGNIITLTDDEAKLCNDGGGCVVIPLGRLRKAILNLQAKCGEMT